MEGEVIWSKYHSSGANVCSNTYRTRVRKKVAQLSTDLSGAVSVKNFNITSNSIASGGYGTLSTNVSQNGYQPLGIIQIYSTNESSTLLQRYLISDNIAYVRIHNRSNAAIEVTFNICILYRKIL